ncbi:hypothetical protein [Bradyrhizobium sp. SRS-191]|uniref:hypothetical protein n=1 Tax=Bradyrhizobium sp. SRS-191 TaxID=2962606 RepID=UPI00211EC372|nr:hypothetical protein [Bradyrhizobium sp. SRS-191]
MIVSTALTQQLERAEQRLGIFFRLGITPVQRLWAGVGLVAISDADDGDVTYRGFGELMNVPAVTQLVNGVADRVDFIISGVSRVAMETAAIESDLVKGATVDLGLGFFDQQLAFAGMIWLYQGEADVLTTSLDASSGSTTRSIKLSVGSAMTGRRRSRQTVFSDFDQQSSSPGDRICERIRRYSQGVNIEWPRY